MNTNPNLGYNSVPSRSLNIAFPLSEDAVNELVKPVMTNAGYQHRLDVDNNMIRMHLQGQYDPQFHGTSGSDYEWAMDAVTDEIRQSIQGESAADGLHFDKVFGIPRTKVFQDAVTKRHYRKAIGIEYGVSLDSESSEFVDSLVKRAFRLRPIRYEAKEPRVLSSKVISMFIPEHDSMYDYESVKIHIKQANRKIEEDRKKPTRILHIPKRFIEPVVFGTK